MEGDAVALPPSARRDEDDERGVIVGDAAVVKEADGAVEVVDDTAPEAEGERDGGGEFDALAERLSLPLALRMPDKEGKATERDATSDALPALLSDMDGDSEGGGDKLGCKEVDEKPLTPGVPEYDARATEWEIEGEGE
jgi:hypothetical protein